MSEIIYLVEVAAHNGTSETTYRFSTGTGYTTLPSDAPANTHYEPRVEHPGLFRQDMFSPGATSGGSSGGYGEIVLINTDGGLDSFVDYGFDGRRCVVKQGVAGAAYSSFATVITGTVEQAEVSWNRVTLRLKDRSAELQVPFQTVFYAGDNALPAGIEGTSELKDKPKPRLFGKCNNVTPVMVNTSKLIYQISASALSTISAVYDNGVALTAGAAYTDQSDMEANAPAAGQYRAWLAGGCFRLGSSPAGTITADAMQGAAATDRTAGQIIKAIVVEKLGAGQVVEQSIIDLDAAAPYTVGYYTGPESVDASAMLDAICASVGAWWGFDNSGLFWSKQLTAPDAAQSIMTLTEAEILSLERTATADSDKGVPIYKVNLDFSKNWTVQTSGLAGSVSDDQLLFEDTDPTQLTEDRRNLLGMEYIRTTATDATVLTKHLLAPEITVKSTIDALADANTEAARLLALRKVRRDRLNVQVPMAEIKYESSGVWDPNLVTSVYESYASVAVHNGYAYKTGGGYGVSASTPTAKVTRCDLTTNSAWDDAAATDLPYPRIEHTSVVYNGYLYVIGGKISGVATSSVIRLNLSSPTGAWDDAGVTDLPIAVTRHTSVVYNGYLYVIGGQESYGYAINKVIRLNLSSPTGAWDDAGVTDLPIVNSAYYMSSSVYGSWVYVIGGTTDSGSAQNMAKKLNLDSPTSSWIDFISPGAFTEHKTVVVGSNIFLMNIPTGKTPVIDILNIDSGWNMDELAGLSFLRGIDSVTYNNSIYVMGGPYGLSNKTYKYSSNSNPYDFNQLFSLGRTVTIKYPRYGYTSGRPMKIIGAESDHSTRTINLELWG